MINMTSHYKYLLVPMMLVTSLVFGQKLKDDLKKYINDPVISKAKNSILAIDLKTGDTLIAYQAKLPLVTASTTKLFSTTMALELLGPDYRFNTRLYIDGKINQGVLNGDLWIRGGGDISFGSHYFYPSGEEKTCFKLLLDSIKSKGIKVITGNVYVDASAFGYEGTPYGWSSADIGNYYGSFPAGLNFYDNVADYYFSTGEVGEKAKFIASYPVQHGLMLNNQILSAKISGENVSLKGKAYNLNRTVTGKLPANKAKFKIKSTVADPERTFGDMFSQQCNENGIQLKNSCIPIRTSKKALPDYARLKLICNLPGKTVLEIINFTNRKSVNFFAEGLLNGSAFHTTGKGTNSNGLKTIRKYLGERIDTTKLKLVDGSGLSRSNRISAAHLCRLLTYVYKSNFYTDFKNSLPIAGVSGTIKDLCAGQACAKRVIAKSGTMSGIKSYAGYINSVSGRTLVFSIITSGHQGNQEYVISKMENLLNALVAQ